MRLKKLELYGFKSFADKTEIVFEPGITCIVGPNGAGKSNVVDSIRWVLGEQSARSLRSTQMDNVIFNGTETRKPLGMGEVALTFSETKGQLSLEFEEVQIMRQIFRGADCEYFINKSPCRLKDISELFLDTGVGTDTYYIMEQGKMDALLSAKPMDRRFIFEEAAGISKYKLRKDEALKKLDQTEQNLLRIKDIIGEVKRQVGSLERYAKKAEKSKKLNEELRAVETALRYSEYTAHSAELKALTEKEAALKAEVEKIEADIITEDNRLQEGRKRLFEEEKNLSGKQEEFYRLASEISNVFNKVNLQGEQKERLQREIEEINSRIADLDRKAGNAKNLTEKSRLEYRETVESLASEKERIAKQIDAIKAAKEKLKQDQKALEEFRIQLFDILNEGVHLKNDLKNYANREQEFKARGERLAARKQEYLGQKSSINDKLAGLKKTLAAMGDSGKFTTSDSIYEYTAGEVKKLEEFEQEISSDFSAAENAESLTLVKKIIAAIKGKWSAYSKRVKPLFLVLQDVEGTVAKKQEEQNYIAELERQDREIALLDAESAQLDSQRAEIKKASDGVSEKLSWVEKKHKEHEEKIKTLELSLADARKNEESDGVLFTDLKVKLTFLEQKEINLKNDIDRLALNLEEIQVNRNLYLKEIEGKSAAIRSTSAETASLSKFLEEIKPKKEALEQAVAGERKNNENIREAFFKDEEKLRALRQDHERKQKKSYEYQLETNKLSHKVAGIKEQVLKEYKLDLASYSPESDYLAVNNISLEAAAQRIGELRLAIEEIGPVNMMAMDEYAELTERYNNLSAQERDLSEGKNALVRTINQLNATTKQLFLETFVKIKNNFNEVFRKLFNGGHADLVLLDEENLLETGIEVIARPPGKRPSNVGMLSGGERAMTAIGLLFAVFMVKPSPFCILDEIDAPLDDSNVIRLRDMLKSTFTNVQFIMITHNKITMEIADVLYGVTQTEPGVSQILSVKLNDIEPSGQVKVSKENAG
ncbi:MAG: AAA family ATPase [Candidatus Firestonebacteria bacterium]